MACFKRVPEPKLQYPSHNDLLQRCLRSQAFNACLQPTFCKFSESFLSMWKGIKCITDNNTRKAQCSRDPLCLMLQTTSVPALWTQTSLTAPDSLTHNRYVPPSVTSADKRRTYRGSAPAKLLALTTSWGGC